MMIGTATSSEGTRLPYNPESAQDSPHLAVRHQLCSSGYLLLRKLQYQVCDGVVTIRGRVPSFFLKQMAQEAVLKLAQIREVRNFVEVCTVQMPSLDFDP
jgi:hypothetical protein